MYPTIISYSNHGYVDFAINMLLSLDRVIRHHRVHIYCLDEMTFDTLAKVKLQNINVTLELVPTQVSSEYERYGTEEYNKITHLKMDLLKEALFRYKFVHFIDCDVVCVQEPPEEHYLLYEKYDVVFQYDSGMRSLDDLFAPTLYDIWCCTGNTTFRNTPGTQYLLQKIKDYQKLCPSKNDQECLCDFFQEGSVFDIREFKQATLFTYDIDRYTNGYWLLHDIGTLENTYFFHANHVKGKEDKIKLLKKANQWFMD